MRSVAGTSARMMALKASMSWRVTGRPLAPRTSISMPCLRMARVNSRMAFGSLWMTRMRGVPETVMLVLAWLLAGKWSSSGWISTAQRLMPAVVISASKPILLGLSGERVTSWFWTTTPWWRRRTEHFISLLVVMSACILTISPS